MKIAELVTKPFLITALADLKTELKTDQADLKTEFVESIAHSERKMIIWMIGLQMATWALLFAVFKN